MMELLIRTEEFEAVATLENGHELRLIGSSDHDAVPAFAKLVCDLHASLVAANATNIVVNIRRLEFLNAGCFNVLVRWLRMIGELPEAQRYKLKFASDARAKWQQRGLQTLVAFAPELVATAE